jgi:hypothetical protein
VTEGEYVPQGSRVQVVRSDGYRHVVRAVAGRQSSAAGNNSSPTTDR